MKIPKDIADNPRQKFSLKTANEAKQLYSEICRGRSSIFMGENSLHEIIYMKHLTEIESSEFLNIMEKYETIATNRGLPTEEEKLKELNEIGAWTNKEEFDYKENLEAVSYARAQLSKLALKSQQDACRNDIKEKEKILDESQKVRNELLDVTSEAWASKKVSKYQVFLSFFKDKGLTQPLFTEDEYDDYGEDDLWEYIILMNTQARWFTEQNIKKIVCWPFFLNTFFLMDDDPSPFFAKPLVDLTMYQTDLLSNARWIKTILSQADKSPSNELYDDLDELIKWYEVENAKQTSKRMKEQRQAKAQARKDSREQRSL